MKRVCVVLAVLLGLGACGQVAVLEDTSAAETTTAAIENSTEVNRPIENLKLPSKSYEGTWYTDEYRLDSLEINDISNGTITFSMGIFRLFGMNAVAKIDGDQIKFSDFDMNGTLEFHKDGITVTIVESDFVYIESGSTFEFGVKGEALTKADFDSIQMDFS